MRRRKKGQEKLKLWKSQRYNRHKMLKLWCLSTTSVESSRSCRSWLPPMRRWPRGWFWACTKDCGMLRSWTWRMSWWGAACPMKFGSWRRTQSLPAPYAGSMPGLIDDRNRKEPTWADTSMIWFKSICSSLTTLGFFWPLMKQPATRLQRYVKDESYSTSSQLWWEDGCDTLVRWERWFQIRRHLWCRWKQAQNAKGLASGDSRRALRLVLKASSILLQDWWRSTSIWRSWRCWSSRRKPNVGASRLRRRSWLQRPLWPKTWPSATVVIVPQPWSSEFFLEAIWILRVRSMEMKDNSIQRNLPLNDLYDCDG